MITALAGGVGAAKFLTGLVKVIGQKNLTAIVNTGDDMDFHGLHISPDLDIVCYTLAGIIDQEKGWGIKGDTFHFLSALDQFGCETWFRVGDGDLATHVMRTSLLKQGLRLSEITAQISQKLGLDAAILPMTDDKVETIIRTDVGTLLFEEYLVKRNALDEVLGVEFRGADTAEAAFGVVEAIMDADRVVLCPSNPVVSIGAILAVKRVREALQQTKARIVAISPIVGGRPLKGPADKLLRGLGLEVSAFTVAWLYRDFLDVFILDNIDVGEKMRVESLGIEVKVTNTLMQSLDDKVRLAEAVLDA